MKKSVLYFHRTINAIKKISNLFRDWEETVHVNSTPDWICEAMEEHPHLLEKRLAFLLSAPAPESEKRQIWTHIFIKALELGRHDLADLADKHISPKGWTALACLPFNSPAVLQKYFYDDIRCLPDFKIFLLHFALQHKGVKSLHARIGWKEGGPEETLRLPPGVLRGDLVKQIVDYQSQGFDAAGGLMFRTMREKIPYLHQIALGILRLARQGDPRAFLLLQSVEDEKGKIFEFLAENISVCDTEFQHNMVSMLPQLLFASDPYEQKNITRALAKILSSPAQEFVTAEGLADMLQFIIQWQLFEQIDDIVENTPSSLLEEVLNVLPEDQKQILSTGGPLCASLVQRHTLQKHTQSGPDAPSKRKM